MENQENVRQHYVKPEVRDIGALTSAVGGTCAEGTTTCIGGSSPAENCWAGASAFGGSCVDGDGYWY